MEVPGREQGHRDDKKDYYSRITLPVAVQLYDTNTVGRQIASTVK